MLILNIRDARRAISWHVHLARLIVEHRVTIPVNWIVMAPTAVFHVGTPRLIPRHSEVVSLLQLTAPVVFFVIGVQNVEGSTAHSFPS